MAGRVLSPRRRRARRAWARLAWRWGLGLLGAVLAGLALWTFWGLPDTRPLRDPKWVQRRFALKEWTTLKDCAPLARRAVLLSEDDIFFRHRGWRFDELGSALWANFRSLSFRRGASSLTQQVVRNAFLDRKKSLRRKLRELILARRADAEVGKRALFEDYLNLAEWGPKCERGIAAAARIYFAKDPSALSPREGALLAWLLPNPRRRGPRLLKGPPPAAKAHAALLLRRLGAEGGLSAAQMHSELKALGVLPPEGGAEEEDLEDE